jgi:hypothetical protein
VVAPGEVDGVARCDGVPKDLDRTAKANSRPVSHRDGAEPAAGRKAVDVESVGCDGEAMSWDAPERCWRFAIGDEPPADLPAAWATATSAVTRDLDCRRHGRPITLANVMWRFVVSGESIAVGFETPGDADVGAYQRCLSYRLETSAVQALVWLANDVQYELAGYEFVQWPIVGQRVLDPRIVDDQAVWVEPSTNAITAPIGELWAIPDHI